MFLSGGKPKILLKKRRIRKQRSPRENRRITVKDKPIKLSGQISNLPALRIVVLDNDECMGQFGYLSLFHQIAFNISKKRALNFLVKCTKKKSKPDMGELDKLMSKMRRNLVKRVARNLLAGGSLRPNARQFMLYLKSLKRRGKIDQVVMYTSAQNTAGYVEFLKDCIEEYCNCKGLYDDVIHYGSVNSVRARDGATKKDFKNVLLRAYKKMGIKGPFLRSSIQEATKNMIMVDDRPYNITERGGVKVAIKGYYGTVPKEAVENVINNTPKYKLLCGEDNIEMLKEEWRNENKDYGSSGGVRQRKYIDDEEFLCIKKIVKAKFDR